MIFTRKTMASSQSRNNNTDVSPIYKNSRPALKKEVVQPVVPPKKTMLWGEPTWFFFHAIAEKVKPEAFSSIRQELLNICFTICNNLPCPNCAAHATQYMKSVNFSAIQTKEQFKMLFFNFHNEVNKRKGYPQFPLAELGPKYSNANLIGIITNFLFHFEEKQRGTRLIVHSMHRDRVAAHAKVWLAKNMDKFSL
jgi:hypothetical protein